MATTYLTRAMGNVDQQKFTWSFWVKRSLLGDEQHLVGNFNDSNNRTHIFFNDDDNLRMYSALSGSVIISYTTNRTFRDTNAWYHIVIAIDTTQAGGNRIRFYVNGEEENSFSQETECNQNTNLDIRSTHYIGRYGGASNHYFSGLMSHLHFIDGTQLTPSSFGSTDATTGEWKINTSPSVTYGSQGYFILKDGNSVTDQSGNSNNFTVGGGTLTNTEDCPSNVFCTINPLFRNRFANQETLTNGNTKMTTGPTDGDKAMLLGTIGVTSGKWYWECKVGTGKAQIGFAYNSIDRFTDFFGSNNPSDGFGVYGDNGNVYYDGANTAYGSSWTTNDIIMVALDMDNKLAWLGKNGTWFNSATQTEIENGTATYDLTTKMGTKQNLNSGEFVFPMFADMTGTGDMGLNVNFGNGYFGTTAVSSAGTNASNIGIFEYDVPTGYTALSTKGLNL